MNRSLLSQFIACADEKKLNTSDENNYYYYFSANGSSACDAMLICARNYGGLEQIKNLFQEDGSVNYRIWISKQAPSHIIQFVTTLICHGDSIYPVIFGIPIHDIVEYIFGQLNSTYHRADTRKYDEISIKNIIRFFNCKYADISCEDILKLLIRNYGAYSAAQRTEKYWIYARGECLPCDVLPYPVYEIVGKQITLPDAGINTIWKSEYSLYKLAFSYYDDAILHYSESWLGSQHIDIYIPCISTGIEYQGQQHYEPLEYFGGEYGLNTRRILDEKKREALKMNGVSLIEWPYTTPITPINFVVKLFDIGIVHLPKPDYSRIPSLAKENASKKQSQSDSLEIRKYSLSGTFVARYKTYKEAASCGISEKQIHKAVSGYCKTAGGYQWRRCLTTDLLGDIAPVRKTTYSNHNKPIYQITTDGEVIAEYASVNDAVKKTGINRKSITCVLNGIQKTAGGYGWIYQLTTEQ